jgi:hypothetical protein
MPLKVSDYCGVVYEDFEYAQDVSAKLHRQPDQHVRALANSAFYLKLATVRFGDHSAEVEPEAVATGIALARWIDAIEGLG